MKRILLIFSLFLSLLSQAQIRKMNDSPYLKDVTDSVAEQLFFDYVNQLRTDPRSFIPMVHELASKNDFFKDWYTDSICKIVEEELIKYLDTVTPQPPLVYFKELRLAMNNHTGIDYDNKIIRFHDMEPLRTFKYSHANENIVNGGTNRAVAPIIYLLLDIHVPDRGHRTSLMSPLYERGAVRCVSFGNRKSFIQNALR